MNEIFNSNQKTFKRRIACSENDILTLLSMSLISDATHIISEETRYHSFEQSQQSSASRDFSLKHILIHTNPSRSFGYKVSSGGCDGTNTNSTSGITTDGTFHQSSSHLGLASSSQSKPIQGTPGPTSSQCLPYKEPVDEPDEEPDDDSISEDVVENSSENTGSPKASNASSSCTNLSTLAEECYRGQGDSYQVGVIAEDLMAIEEQQRRHHSTLDKGRSNGMFLNPRSLTPS